jgi:hypothetical protein
MFRHIALQCHIRVQLEFHSAFRLSM